MLVAEVVGQQGVELLKHLVVGVQVVEKSAQGNLVYDRVVDDGGKLQEDLGGEGE